MKSNERNDSKSGLKEQNITKEVIYSNKGKLALTYISLLINLVFGDKEIFKILINGLIEIIKLSFPLIYDLISLFLQHKVFITFLLIFILLHSLPSKKKKVLRKLLKSLAALVM